MATALIHCERRIRMNKNEPLEGVKCLVNTYTYNKDERECVAFVILVEPKNARSSNQTDSFTFKPMN